MRRLLHPMLHAGLLLLGVAACGGGGDETPPPIRPPQALAELTLLAGSLQVGGCDHKDGVGSEARLYKPGPIAIDGSGSIHFFDSYWGRMRVLDPQGRVSTTTVPGQLPVEEAGGLRYFPIIPAIAFGADGSRYFAARNDLRFPPDYIRDPKGWVILRANGDGPIGLYADPARQAQPIEVGNTIGGMALDSQGRLLVVDTEACSVRRVELDRSVSTLFTTASASDPAACLRVHALAVDGNNELAYVLSDGTLRRRNAAGSERTVAGVTIGSHLGNDPGESVYLAFDSQGRLLISEGGAQRVRALSADGTLSILADNPGGPERPRPLAAPTGVVASPAGPVFVADEFNCTISRIEADGRLQVLAGLADQNGFRDGPGPQARFGPGFRFTTDEQGNAFVADTASRVVRRIDRSGRVSTIAGTPDPGNFDGVVRTQKDPAALLWAPSALAALTDGRLLVLDIPDVKRVSQAGEVSSWPPGAPGALSERAMLDMGPGNTLHALDVQLATCYRCGPFPTFISIWRWSTDGSRTTLLDQDSDPNLRTALELNAVPRGFAVAADGRVYFTVGSAVYRRDSSGVIVLLAGSSSDWGHQDGEGAAARFYSPMGIAADPFDPGVLYVADTGNHLIRKIDAQGRVSTVLGRPGQRGNVLGAAPAGLDSPREVRVIPGGLLISTAAAVLKFTY